MYYLIFKKPLLAGTQSFTVDSLSMIIRYKSKGFDFNTHLLSAIQNFVMYFLSPHPFQLNRNKRFFSSFFTGNLGFAKLIIPIGCYTFISKGLYSYHIFYSDTAVYSFPKECILCTQ
jgi:hypothetical protein